MKIFLELQCLDDDLVDILELSAFINASLPLPLPNLLSDEVDSRLEHEINNNNC